MPSEESIRLLEDLAGMYGVQLSYINILDGRSCHASPETLLAVLKGLRAPVEKLGDVEEAVRRRRREILNRTCEPVTVAWDGKGPKLPLRLLSKNSGRIGECLLKLEFGEERRWEIVPAESDSRREENDGVSYCIAHVDLPGNLPPGYHSVSIELGNSEFKILVISAPRRAFVPEEAASKRWAVFVPAYAVHSQKSWGVGDFGDLSRLMDWVRGQGGKMIGTLPMLSSFLSEPFDPSPYSPVSRLFWNELLIDIGASPEFAESRCAQELVGSAEFESERNALQQLEHVDYRRAMALKRRALDCLAHSFFGGRSQRREGFAGYLASQKELRDYAEFRATCDLRKTPWRMWPEPSRSGRLCADDYRPEDVNCHLYAQWLADQQISGFAKGRHGDGEGLYLDLPLGVNSDGYDVWRERDSFVLDAGAGAPPDGFFTKGQNWGFPPMHPERMRESGYGYFRRVLEHHLRHAGALRIDHVMGLHRLFWIPNGFEPADGAYVQYPAEELYAILALESARNRTMIVGEDLGTVPPELRPTLTEHNIQRMYVLQFEARPDPAGALPAPAEDAVAVINTHDMPPFASFWKGADIEDRLQLGLFDSAGAKSEEDRRDALRACLTSFLRGKTAGAEDDLRAMLKACIEYLGSSESRLVVVSLEDLWFEQNPQNVPGTSTERPNWKRKLRYGLEELAEMPAVAGMLSALNEARQRKES